MPSQEKFLSIRYFSIQGIYLISTWCGSNFSEVCKWFSRRSLEELKTGLDEYCYRSRQCWYDSVALGFRKPASPSNQRLPILLSSKLLAFMLLLPRVVALNFRKSANSLSRRSLKEPKPGLVEYCFGLRWYCHAVSH